MTLVSTGLLLLIEMRAKTTMFRPESKLSDCQQCQPENVVNSNPQIQMCVNRVESIMGHSYEQGRPTHCWKAGR